jgi:LPS sulfotransferase NodH
MKPERSYTIWFSQRTGSTLLARALGSTGIAGKPEEWLLPEDLIQHYQVRYHAELQERLWELGSSPNRVFGVKYGFYEPQFTRILKTFQLFPGSPGSDQGGLRARLWEIFFN